MVSFFFICLLLSEVVFSAFDKLPLLFYGSAGLYYLATTRSFRIIPMELFYLGFCIALLLTSIMVAFSGNTLQYLIAFLLQAGLFSYIFTRQSLDRNFLKNSVASFINWSVFIGLLGIADFLLFEVGVVSPIRDYFYVNKVDSLYGSPNIFGVMSSFALMFLIRQEGIRNTRLWVYAKMAVLFLSVILSVSGMSLGLLILYLLLEKMSIKKVFYLTLTAILGIILFEMYVGISNIPLQVILNKRFELWVAAFEMWSQSKILGIGTGNFQLTNTVSFDADVTGQNYGLHSMYMWLIVETGIFGTLMFGAVLWCAMARALRRKSHYELTFLILLMVSQLTESFLQYEDVFMLFFWLIIAAFGQNSTVFQRKPGSGPPKKIAQMQHRIA